MSHTGPQSGAEEEHTAWSEQRASRSGRSPSFHWAGRAGKRSAGKCQESWSPNAAPQLECGQLDPTARPIMVKPVRVMLPVLYHN